ncbi:MAG: NADPH-dependent glutamate synthase [Candidatus Woesearchaeota archaeon]
MNRVEMRQQLPRDRIKNFDSVPLGYSAEEAVQEAKRCIQCKVPQCESSCPVGMAIKEMVGLIAAGQFSDAFLVAKKDNPIPAIAGRVCPQEDQCEKKCALKKNSIDIGKLEAFVGDYAIKNPVNEPLHNTRIHGNVAVVGSGPAGITCAVDLARLGYKVTVFEALHMTGGVLQYGIPSFRLPHDIVRHELSYLKKLGVDIQTNSVVGRTIQLEELRHEYKAVFLGTGAGSPVWLGIEGEKLKGVYSANEFLFRINMMKAHDFPIFDTPVVCRENVGVIGAGNVAMDSARCALRLGAKKVTILYRRTMDHSPARIEEVRHAAEEGVEFVELVAPVRILGNSEGWVEAIGLARMQLTENDKSGRPSPVIVPGSEFVMNLDTVINAVGTRPNRLFLSTVPGLETQKNSCIKVDENLMTNILGVFAGGDAITGSATVIQAMADGRKAARSMHEYLSSNL